MPYNTKTIVRVFVVVFVLSIIVWSFVAYEQFSGWCYDQTGHIIALGQGHFACFTTDGRILGSLTDWMLGKN